MLQLLSVNLGGKMVQFRSVTLLNTKMVLFQLLKWNGLYTNVHTVNATMCSFSLSYSAFGLTYPDLARQPIIVALGTSDNWFSGGTGGQSGTGLPGHQGAGNAILDLLSNRP